MLNAAHRQRGVSLIEIMIGLVVGMLVLAGTTTTFTAYLNSNRNVVMNARLNQEMRAVMDLVTRDIRRAGYWDNAISGVWYSGTPGVAANNYADISVSANTQISYGYARDADDAVGTSEQFGFRLNAGSFEMLKDGNWLPVTDSNMTTITALTITPTNREVSLSEYCVVACTSNCPVLTIREVDVSVKGRVANDSAMPVREIRERVRLRNDKLSGACPAV